MRGRYAENRLAGRAVVLAAILNLLGLVSVARADYLTKKELALLKQHWPDYKYASAMTGMPVEILAAIHYRESGLLEGYYSKRRQAVIHNIGGPFMLDLGPRDDGKEFARRIRNYEYKVYRLYGGRGEAPRVDQNFRFAALVAAHELKTKDRGRGLADAVWGYNGRSGQSVMNKNAYLYSDPQRGRRLSFNYTGKDGANVSFLDERPGVMVIYNEIKSRHIAGAH